MEGLKVVGILLLFIVVLIVYLEIVLPKMIENGINVSKILDTTKSGFSAADNLVEALKTMMPENTVINVTDRIIEWGKQAAAAAEQLYLSRQLSKDERKEKAISIVYELARTAGIEVDDQIKTITEGAIEAAVFALPKTSTVLKE